VKGLGGEAYHHGNGGGKEAKERKAKGYIKGRGNGGAEGQETS